MHVLETATWYVGTFSCTSAMIIASEYVCVVEMVILDLTLGGPTCIMVLYGHSVMHLSMLSPTTPLPGLLGDLMGI